MLNETNPDCVVFMTTYSVNKLKKKHMFHRKSANKLLEKHHIESVLTDSVLLTKNGGFKCNVQYDSLKQTTDFHFNDLSENCGTTSRETELSQIGWALCLRHSLELLLDTTLFEIDYYITLEKFFVKVNSRLLQVDPLAFVLNDVVFVCFELIDFDTDTPLSKSEIYGKSNNYNILPIQEIRYFNEETFAVDKRTIPHIIFDNIVQAYTDMTKGKVEVVNVSWSHNILIMIEDSADITDVILETKGSTHLDINVKNLNDNEMYEYYSTDDFGLITSIKVDDTLLALFSGIMLESLKMFCQIKQIVSFEVIHNFDETVNSKMMIDGLSFMLEVPIITRNAIDNIKEMYMYKNFNEAIDFKIKYLNYKQDKRKNSNALWLNVLLYIFALFGGVESIYILCEEFNWPVGYILSMFVLVFIGLGIGWVVRDRKEK